MHQQPGFRDPHHPDYVCLLKKSLYALKQAPRTWYQRFAEFVATLGFSHSTCDHSLFIYHNGNATAYILLYVDDIILTTSSDTLRQIIMSKLSGEFTMKDLGRLSYFMDISVTRHSYGIFLSQHKYAVEIIERAGYRSLAGALQYLSGLSQKRSLSELDIEVLLVSTPVDTKAKLSGLSGNPYHDPSEYRSLTGALQYLTFTKPDIAYVVQQLCLLMHDPRTIHMTALKRIIRYIKGIIHHGLHISPSLVDSLTTYTDAD